ncbi:hypothetical protein [Streptomyces sp. NBC_00035]|uniref:hypothetical protein n=1 Tax=Streptomyces sp. NBC_00035 TaxID=2903614 RepID=UPI0032453668
MTAVERAVVTALDTAAFASYPSALDKLRQELRMDGWHDAAQLEQFLTHLGEGAIAMLFRCTHLAYADAS